MKDYFGFNLEAVRLLPIWLAFYALFIVPYAFLVYEMNTIQPGTHPHWIIFVLILLVIFVGVFFIYFLTRIMIESFTFKDRPIVFNGKFGKFALLSVGGVLLSILTLTVYTAWFIRDMHRFFINNSVTGNESFTFKGKGLRLFVILFVTIAVLFATMGFLMMVVLKEDPDNASSGYKVIQQVVTWIIMIPYMYLVYKWMVDIVYKNYHIKWETKFWNSCGKIALEFLLTAVTLGIYYPMAVLKLYTYFIERTVAVSENGKRKFGFETNHLNDFLFFWGQILLLIITLGIYYPWLISKIGKRIYSRTYLERNITV